MIQYPFIGINNNMQNNYTTIIRTDKFNESLHKAQKKYKLSR